LIWLGFKERNHLHDFLNEFSVWHGNILVGLHDLDARSIDDGTSLLANLFL
jgi:hypothetical protein